MQRITKSEKQPTQLFIIRVWTEKLGDGKSEWRGKVQDISEAGGYYFQGWLALIGILQTLVSEGHLEDDKSQVIQKGERRLILDK